MLTSFSEDSHSFWDAAIVERLTHLVQSHVQSVVHLSTHDKLQQRTPRARLATFWNSLREISQRRFHTALHSSSPLCSFTTVNRAYTHTSININDSSQHQGTNTHRLLEVFVLIESRLRSLVEGGEVSDIRWALKEVRISLLHVQDKHSELGTPVTNVVGSHNLDEHSSYSKAK